MKPFHTDVFWNWSKQQCKAFNKHGKISVTKESGLTQVTWINSSTTFLQEQCEWNSFFIIKMVIYNYHILNLFFSPHKCFKN